jgi:hypothetical protein
MRPPAERRFNVRLAGTSTVRQVVFRGEPVELRL